jgi:hypothetical protein
MMPLERLDRPGARLGEPALPTGGPMQERRRLTRRTLIYYLRVFDLDTGEDLGHLVDITTEGILVMSTRPIDVGRAFRLGMELPLSGSAPGKERIEFAAESLRSARDVNHDFVDTAFRVTALDRGHRSRIETLIDDYGFRD